MKAREHGLIRGLVGPLAVLVGLFGGGVAVMAVSLPQLVLAERWAGTPGEFTVGACDYVDRSRRHGLRCEGTFRSDDGATGDPDAVMSYSGGRDLFPPGTVWAVQRAGNGDYARVGQSAAFSRLAVILFGAAMTGTGALGGLAVVGQARSARSGESAGRGPSVRGLRFRGGWIAVAVSLGTALLCALIAFVAQMTG